VKQGIAFRRDLLQGEVLLAADSLDEAILVGEKASPLGMPPLMHPWNLLPYNVPFLKDGLARAYQKRGDTDRAIAEYERLIVFDPGMAERTLVHPLYHYRLAGLYEEKGELDKAVQQYETFLNVWKNADEGLPESKDARARLDNLRKVSAG
jgi:tetratricopeptide (TPR) repeat protein